jgi:hypothetical protein
MNDTPQSLTLVNPAELNRISTEVAHVCKEIVTRTAMDIQGRKYVRVEGWQSIATAHGCVASARNVEEVEGGVRAIGEIRRLADGALLATAEGFVGQDEAVWYGGTVQTKTGSRNYPPRAKYAIRAMAQTRAISRACRTAFAHVVVLMDAGLETTPAEEVPSEGFGDKADKAIPVQVVKEAPAPAVTELKGWRGHKIHFGKNSGVQLGTLGDNQLRWYIENCYPAKEFKGKITPEAQSLADALKAAADELGIATAKPINNDLPQTEEEEIKF